MALAAVIALALLSPGGGGAKGPRTSGNGGGHSSAVAQADVAQADVAHAASRRVLSRLAVAVADRDEQGAAALGGNALASAALSTIVANAAALEVEGFTVGQLEDVTGIDDAGEWAASAVVSWRFGGFDTGPAQARIRVGFQIPSDPETEGASAVVTDFGVDGRAPLWLTGPVQVQRSDRVLVLASDADHAQTLAQRGQAALAAVAGFLPRWRGGAVIEMPASADALDAALGVPPGTYRSIAAVTASVDGVLTPGAQLHVFVNPETYLGLDPVGGQVVLGHEITHLATRAPLSAAVPLWLREGFADYVALRSVELPLDVTARQIIEQVRDHGVPERLPGPLEFDSAATHLGAAYESAWLACQVLVEVAGERRLVGLYQAVARGARLDQELPRRFGITEGELVERWQARLREIAAWQQQD